MSVFPGRAPQISARKPRPQTSQQRAGKIGAAFRFVSSGSLGAKWHAAPLCALSRYNAREGQSVRDDHAGDSRGTAFVHCVHSRQGHAQPKGEPAMADDIARGRR
ncbi:hypothetical protein [Bradyrhizobium retamae]|uniref:hypothetical protein n=1 Tax=Bradyrhizobium retamae TaxID=1300035 RepID=UPI0012E3EE9E